MAGTDYKSSLVEAARLTVGFEQLADEVAGTLNSAGPQVHGTAGALSGAAVNAFTRLLALWEQKSREIQDSMNNLGHKMGTAIHTMSTAEQRSSQDFGFVGGEAGTVATGAAGRVNAATTAMSTRDTDVDFRSAIVHEICGQLRALLAKLKGQLDEAEATAKKLSTTWQAVSEAEYQRVAAGWHADFNQLNVEVQGIETRAGAWDLMSSGAERANQATMAG